MQITCNVQTGIVAIIIRCTVYGNKCVNAECGDTAQFQIKWKLRENLRRRMCDLNCNEDWINCIDCIPNVLSLLQHKSVFLSLVVVSCFFYRFLWVVRWQSERKSNANRNDCINDQINWFNCAKVIRGAYFIKWMHLCDGFYYVFFFNQIQYVDCVECIHNETYRIQYGKWLCHIENNSNFHCIKFVLSSSFGEC